MMLRGLGALSAVVLLALAAGCATRGGGVEVGTQRVASAPELGELSAIGGVLRGVDGEPLGGALVSLTPASQVAGSSSLSTTSDAEGRFSLERVAPGSYRLWSQTLAESELLTEETPVVLAPATRTSAELSFGRWVPVRGTVRIGGEVPPAIGFRVDLVAEDRRHELRLDGNGAYSSRVLPGEYKVGVTSGYFGLRMMPGTVTIPAKDGGDLAIDIPTGSATVRLTGGGEAPKGMLTAEYETFTEPIVSRIALYGAEVRLKNLLPGEYAVGAILDNGLQAQSPSFSVAAGNNTDVNLELSRPEIRTFQGKLRLEPGRYAYKFYAPADNWQDDILNPMKVGEGVMANAVFSVPGGAKAADGSRLRWPAVDDSTNEVTFRVSMPTLRDTVYVRGTFANWRRSDAYRLQRVPERAFELTTTIPAGVHEYKFYSPSEDIWFVDPSNPGRRGSDFEINNVLEVPADGSASPDGAWPQVRGGSVTFRAELPTFSDELYVRGSFNNWEIREEHRLLPR
ncbi:MAG: hypothetical protein SF028_13730 [Candidatus Sumerlaeia bacterium]|nr:hypothetical protein [Candidatus Sumerlaeia bacterium]